MEKWGESERERCQRDAELREERARERRMFIEGEGEVDHRHREGEREQI